MSLTLNAIQSLFTNDDPGKPVIQLLGVKKISGATPEDDRFRLLLSDGKKCTTSVLLATQLNSLITSGQLETNTIIRIDKHVVNIINEDKRILVVLELTILTSGSKCQKIGTPEPYKHNVQTTTGPTSNAPVGKGHTPHKDKANIGPINPIASLTPYQNRWVIKARVTNKTNIKTWSNSRGEGKLFSVDMLDDSGEIRGTFFNDQCDKFYNIIESGKVYYITKATLKAANRNFTAINNDYEISFHSESSIIPCDDTMDVPNTKYLFVPIKQIVGMEKDQNLDVLGVVIDVSEIQTIVSRAANKEVHKRTLTIMDQSGYSIQVVLWANDAETFALNSSTLQNDIMAIKSARISEFNGKYLNISMSSTYLLNPDYSLVPEAKLLKNWAISQGDEAKTRLVNISQMEGGTSGVNGMGDFNTPYKYLYQIKDENLGMNDKADYFSCVCSIVYFKKENCLYQACPQPECNKKIIDMNNGRYRCEKCGKDFDTYKWRFLLSINIADFSSSHWITAFQESAECILGISADQLGQLKIDNPAAFDDVFQEATLKTFLFKLKARIETFNDETRLKVTCMQAKPVDYAEENRRLTEELKKISIGA